MQISNHSKIRQKYHCELLLPFPPPMFKGLLPYNGELPRDIFRTADSKLLVTSKNEIEQDRYIIVARF